MTLTIVIPFYKISFFEKTLLSLARQTNKRFRVFVGDDAAPVSAETLVAGFKDKIDIQYHRFDTNLGGKNLTQQWDRCVAMAPESDWIMLLGDDDFLDENAVASFYEVLALLEKINVVRFASRMITMPGNQVGKTFFHPEYESAISAFARRHRGETRSTMSEYIFRKKAYQSVGFRDFPLAWHSDDAAWIEFSGSAEIYSINKAAVNITISPESISGNEAGLMLKKQATVRFYKEIILPRIMDFPVKDRLSMLYAAEVAIKDCRKLTPQEWKLLFSAYIKTAKLMPFLRFLRRYVLKKI